MKGSMGNLMRQAQQMQEQMKRAQEELAQAEVTGSAGGGMVEITLTGRHEVRRVKISPELLSEDAEMLEDMVAAAFNDAVNKVAEMIKERFSGMAGGLDLPAGMKLPF